MFWTGLPAVELPPDIVARFDDKVMALVGFEADQVRRTPDGDVSVPITVAYNHHYGSTMLGKGSRMERVRMSETKDHRAMHPGPEPGWAEIPVEHTASKSGAPTSLPFGYSNGGEFRKTYHGLVPPFAQLIDSPRTISVTPMQIDTWNRAEMNITGGKFVAGPAPKLSYAPLTGPDAVYSGLLECPLTTRLRKQLTGGGWNDSFAVQLNTCEHPIDSAATCFAVGAQIGVTGAVSTTTGSSTTLPSGCSVQLNSTGAHLFFNTNSDSAASCGSEVTAIKGHEASLVTLDLSVDRASDNVTITMSGPSAVWFGVGFDTQFMSNSPYAIIIDGVGAVTERVLGEHTAGILLNASVTVVRSVVQGGIRTVTLTRPLEGLTPHHHTFDPTQMSLDFINALGSDATFGYHKTKTTATIALWPAAAAPDPTAAGGIFSYLAGSYSTADAPRNNYLGEVGFQIETIRPLTVTALGRGGASLKAGARVTIWDVESGKAVASTVVASTANATVEGGYTYVNLTSPVQLRGGAQYRVSLSCTLGMPDLWVDTAANAGQALGAVAALGNGYYSAKVGALPQTASTAGRWAGIATFKVKVAPHPVPPSAGPPATCVCSIPAAPFGQGKGTLKYLPTGEVIGFPFRCNLGDADYSVMKNKNPTCDIRTYGKAHTALEHRAPCYWIPLPRIF